MTSLQLSIIFQQEQPSYEWFVDDAPVVFPLPNFTETGTHTITLKASNATHSSMASRQINVVGASVCNLSCDLTQETLYPISSTCPDTEDGGIYSEVSSAVGRSFYYELLDSEGNLLKTQNTGYFTDLAAGDYQIIVRSDNDASCSLDFRNH